MSSSDLWTLASNSECFRFSWWISNDSSDIFAEQLQYYKPGRDNQDLLDFAAASKTDKNVGSNSIDTSDHVSQFVNFCVFPVYWWLFESV